MKKHLILALVTLGLAHGLFAAAKPVYQLDAASSTLVASALKNESVTVAVKFPFLTGSLDPATAKASVKADLKGLSEQGALANYRVLHFASHV